ncbi:MAG: hypothetical protein HKN43_02550 [Rhodothermales bacterium]|nr:hypothetical protein [Rhodothermales bacterium]
MANSGWSRLHDIGLIFLACMHGTDDEIDPSEYTLVRELLKQHVADDSEDAEKVFDEVMLMYVSQTVYEMVEGSIASLSAVSTTEELATILKDLADIAAADGLVYPEEVRFITDIAEEWGLGDYLTGDRSRIS